MRRVISWVSRPLAITWRSGRSDRTEPAAPLRVSVFSIRDGALRTSAPGVFCALCSRSLLDAISYQSISLLASASGKADESSVRYRIRSSLAGVPHQRGSRLSVIVCPVWSIDSTLNGPALTGMEVFHAVLNDAGVEVREAGRNGSNSAFHSANG